jgi:NADH dehydrogenase FAD-containing subunit
VFRVSFAVCSTQVYWQVVISPKNYFLFTPLLPSVAVGTLSPRSIIQPTRYVTRHKTRAVEVIEAEAQHVDVRSLSPRNIILLIHFY